FAFELVGQRRVDGIQSFVDERVDSTQEETGDGCDIVDRLARGEAQLQSIRVRVCERGIALDAEQQGDVYIDARGGELAHRVEALDRARYLDHQVRSIHERPQALTLLDRPP